MEELKRELRELWTLCNEDKLEEAYLRLKAAGMEMEVKKMDRTDDHWEVTTFYLGRAHLAMGFFPQALFYFKRVLESLGSNFALAAALFNYTGQAQAGLHMFTEAAASYDHAYRQLRYVKETNEELAVNLGATILNNQGNLALHEQNPEQDLKKALQLFKNAFNLLQDHPDERLRYHCLSSIGNAHSAMREWPSAIEKYKEAREGLKGIEPQDEAFASILNNLGSNLLDQQEEIAHQENLVNDSSMHEILVLLKQSLDIFKGESRKRSTDCTTSLEIEDSRTAYLHLNFARFYFLRSRTEEAKDRGISLNSCVEHCNKALRIIRSRQHNPETLITPMLKHPESLITPMLKLHARLSSYQESGVIDQVKSKIEKYARALKPTESNQTHQLAMMYLRYGTTLEYCSNRGPEEKAKIQKEVKRSLCRSIQLFEEAKEPVHVASAKLSLARVLQQDPYDYSESDCHYSEALRILGDRSSTNLRVWYETVDLTPMEPSDDPDKYSTWLNEWIGRVREEYEKMQEDWNVHINARV